MTGRAAALRMLVRGATMLASGGALLWAGAALGQGGLVRDSAAIESIPTPPGLLGRSSQERSTGDYPEMRERGQIRVLVHFDKTNFFLTSQGIRGLEYDAMSGFADFLHAGDKRRHRIRLVFIPMAFEDLIPALKAGEGDVIAAGMTVTTERKRHVAFAEPYVRDVDELIVRHKEAAPAATVAALSGRRVHVPRGSSYAGHLRKENERLAKAGKPPIRVVEAESGFETEDLLEMANAGIIDYAVADSHLARLWAKVLPDIAIEEGAAVNRGGRIAWAVRQSNPELLARLNAYVALMLKDGGKRAQALFARYYGTVQWAKNPAPVVASARAREYRPHFERYSRTYGFDYRLMMAQGFQESGLNQAARSAVGAIGVMQLMPETGRSLHVGDIAIAPNNIHGGIKYMQILHDTYFDEPAIAPKQRLLFALAAYNAGPNRVNALRRKAAQMGLDPNVWSLNVERVAALSIGEETVRYVSNINMYYVALSHRELPGADGGAVPARATPAD